MKIVLAYGFRYLLVNVYFMLALRYLKHPIRRVQMSSFIILGCGYVGTRLAGTAQGSGFSVSAMVRTQDSAAALQSNGVSVVKLDLDRDSAAAVSMGGEVLFYLVPPPASGIKDTRIANFLKNVPEQLPRRLVYLSTTGVYGDCQGDWVDEKRQPAPGNDRARRRLDAEQQFAAFARARGVELVILRVAGIYGPGRLPRQRLERGEPVLDDAKAPISNRIHVDDLVQVLIAAGVNPEARGIYNVSDGHPSSMTDYLSRVASILELPQPRRIGLHEMDNEIGAGMRSYLAESRRLDNRRMIQQLGVELRYQDLAQGLRASLD